ncbi:MAG TPA: hypothetical protein ENK43_03015 [Planctomycetes bacterium]|nr:hypothetical protein [Planctomycetota bacterium]
MTLTSETRDSRLTRRLLSLVALGLLIFLVGLIVAPERAWGGWLAASAGLFSLGLAGPFFMAMFALTRARWADPLRPILEAMGTLVTPAAIALYLTLLGSSTLYAWASSDAHGVSHNGWLGIVPVAIRQAVVLAAFVWLSRRMIQGSVRRREGTESEDAELLRSGLFLLAFAFLISLVGIDWLMSLDVHWYSTMYGVYLFAGTMVGGISLIAILAIVPSRPLTLGSLRESQIHDLGKLLFVWGFFWAYIWFCQWMLIWYTDIPEEASWYTIRMQNGWKGLFYLDLILNGAVPFLVLLSAGMKKKPHVVVRVAAIVLIGRALDLFILVTPVVVDRPPSGLWEFGPVLAAGAFLFWKVLVPARASSSLLAEAPLSS